MSDFVGARLPRRKLPREAPRQQAAPSPSNHGSISSPEMSSGEALGLDADAAGFAAAAWAAAGAETPEIPTANVKGPTWTRS